MDSRADTIPDSPQARPKRRRGIPKIPATIAFLSINAIVFGIAEYVGDTTTVDTLVQFGASGRYWVWRGEPWRLLTSVFLHIGVIHFLWNTWGLLGWCREVETSLGSLRFAAIYLLTGIGASAGSVIGHNVISAGASGAGFGIVGTLLVLKAHEEGSVRSLLRDPRARGMLQGIAIWLVLGLFMNMDNVAHGTGLVLGVIAGAAFTAERRALRAIPVALTALLALLASFPLPVIHAAAR